MQIHLQNITMKTYVLKSFDNRFLLGLELDHTQKAAPAPQNTTNLFYAMKSDIYFDGISRYKKAFKSGATRLRMRTNEYV